MAASGQKSNNQVNKPSPFSPTSQDYLNRIEQAEKANDEEKENQITEELVAYESAKRTAEQQANPGGMAGPS